MKVNDDAGTTSHVFPSVQVNDENVFVGWIDRRLDPANQLTNEWADVSHDGGHTFGADQVESDVATTWNVRADARPNFGDYNSSALVGGRLALVWADGRFGQPAGSAATPDTIFTVATGLGDFARRSDPSPEGHPRGKYPHGCPSRCVVSRCRQHTEGHPLSVRYTVSDADYSATEGGVTMADSETYVRQREGDWYVADTGVPVYAIIAMWQQGYSPEEIQISFPAISQIEAYETILYYLKHRREMDAYFRASDARFQQLKAETEARNPEFYAECAPASPHFAPLSSNGARRRDREWWRASMPHPQSSVIGYIMIGAFALIEIAFLLWRRSGERKIVRTTLRPLSSP